MKLKDIAHLRCGDKGNDCNICVIPCRDEFYHIIREQLTADVVHHFYSEHCRGAVYRYDLPKLKAFNFVMTDALNGGVTSSLGIDRHGKTLAMALAELELDV